MLQATILKYRHQVPAQIQIHTHVLNPPHRKAFTQARLKIRDASLTLEGMVQRCLFPRMHLMPVSIRQPYLGLGTHAWTLLEFLGPNLCQNHPLVSLAIRSRTVIKRYVQITSSIVVIGDLS